MYIFYDFETSDKDFLGQILSYYFVLVDDTYSIIREYDGVIQPNRMELPRVEALLVNQLSLDECHAKGQSEFDAANGIYDFLQTATNEYGALPLVGFNSARFDFKHLEKLLLKYGLSPTFYGKISSLDIYQFTKYCALTNIDSFPFIAKKYNDTPAYSFKLEHLAKAFNCLDTPQTHDAKDDVLLTIELTKALESRFNTRLALFRTQQHNTQSFTTPGHQLKEPYLAFEQTANTPIVNTRHWMVIGTVNKSTFILLDIDAYQKSARTSLNDYGAITRYFNTRSNALYVSSHPLTDTNQVILNDPHIQTIRQQASDYFSLFPVDWDIEYRPWAMGFTAIPILRQYIERLCQNPNDYDAIIHDWRQLKQNDPERSSQYNLMIQLFNRYYLNHHPSPKKEHIQKYITKRYATGALYRNSADATHPIKDIATARFHLANPSTTPRTTQLLTEHITHAEAFIAQYLPHTSPT